MKKRFVWDHDLHIHSRLSSCSNDPGQTPERLLAYAKENGLITLCLTDHYWDSAVPDTSLWYAPQNFEHISQSRPLPLDPEVNFLFGCETELRADLTLGIPDFRFKDFDFVVIPTTHLHMTGHTLSREDAASLEARARLWTERLEGVLNKDLPFRKIGIAHLACPLLSPTKETYATLLDMIPAEDMKRLFAKAASLGVGIELNSADMDFCENDAEAVLRIFRIAKQEGCKFYFASDAHHPDYLPRVKPIFERTIDLLELTEDDKFAIPSKTT
ncbi:MAG: hypothetical protein E7643_07480 [Ruminococcaceae bacterium]|nr:hypothetical protein [Oscillospiraceae bacterium]